MLVSNRTQAATSTEGGSNRIVTSFLTEMDGIFSKGSQTQVFIIATSSNINQIDPAVLRPGRIDIHTNLSLPQDQERIDIINGLLKKIPHELDETHVKSLARKTMGKSCSDLVDMMREASMKAIRSSKPALDHMDFI